MSEEEKNQEVIRVKTFFFLFFSAQRRYGNDRVEGAK